MRSLLGIIGIAIAFSPLAPASPEKALQLEQPKPSLIVNAILKEITPVPRAKDIDSYSRALSIYGYEVTQVIQGKLTKKNIRVLRWTIWEKRVLPNLPTKTGAKSSLKLVPFSSMRGFQNDRRIGLRDSDTTEILYYDLSSYPTSRSTTTWKQLAKQQSEGIKTGVLQGQHKPWLYLASELKHAQAGKFWENWGTSDAPAKGSPLATMLDFKQRLSKQNVELLLIPIPTKIDIYPEFLAPHLPTSSHSQFVTYLKEQNLWCIDLYPSFQKLRRESNREAFCKTDSHWSPDGALLASKLIAAELEKRPWYTDTPKKEYEKGMLQLLEVQGDLAHMLSHAKKVDLETLGKETLAPEPISEKGTANKKIPLDQPDSSIILVGDSYTRVFSTGKGMLATSSGLAEHLALQTGIAPDVITSNGSGTHGARINLYKLRSANPKTPNYWKAKRAVIWCFSVKEFTLRGKWSTSIPVFKK